MSNTPDGTYDDRPYNKTVKEAMQLGPNALQPERLTSDRILATLSNVSMISAAVTQLQTFRPKFGYRTRALTVSDVVNADSLFESDFTDTYFTGAPAGYSGSSRNNLGEV